MLTFCSLSLYFWPQISKKKKVGEPFDIVKTVKHLIQFLYKEGANEKVNSFPMFGMEHGYHFLLSELEKKERCNMMNEYTRLDYR